MGKESGVNCVFQLSEEDSPESFVDLSGQRNTQYQRQASTTDVADKTTGGWGATIAGPRSVTVTVSGVAVFPGTADMEVLRQRWDPGSGVGTTIRGKLKENAAGQGYVGDFYITQFDISAPHDGATEYSITLQNAGALQWDAAA